MKRKVLAVLLAASMMGTLGACGSSDSGKQTDAKTDDSSSTETTDSGEASADSSDGSFDGVKIEVDIEDSIQGDQNTRLCTIGISEGSTRAQHGYTHMSCLLSDFSMRGLLIPR